ncbi:protein I'm not dead yet-like [Formica exsecta]|uniref:protein I'm not dead yet-like n=1 Tax=Formica exsecta TaxID=72781 RepID=UPI001141EEAA|nr:protein I'm not dead yet-like [Formica exsecta]
MAEKRDDAGEEPMERVERREELVDYLRKLLSCLRDTGHFLKIYWKILFALFWALFLLPFLLIYDCSEVRCAYVVLLMGGYWVTDCFPMAVTSLIPVVMFPALGILSTADTCTCYMNDTIMVFIGGLILAIAIEHSNLHLRIALGVMKTVGCSHARLLGGLCVVTTFISMWVSNTAATAMMVPIIFAVLRELEQAGVGAVFKSQIVDPERPDIPSEIRPTKITKAYLLAAAYCSTFGGTGTLVGTGTNLTFKGIYESTFPKAEGISFTEWMIASFPQMVVNSFLTWMYVRIAFLGYLRPRSKDAEMATIGTEGEAVTNQVIQQRYKNLGPVTFHEYGVATLFFMCVFLWIFRKPGFVVGWSELITDIDLRDSVPVIFASILMFFIPKDPSFIYSYSQDPAKRPKRSSEGLITWKVIETKMPWSLMFLLGGGFAISRGSVASCMAKRVGEALLPLRYLPPVVILALVCFFEGTLTEFTSNVGIANITLPVIAQMCVAMEIHPMYLMIPATLMCSFSFRLPVGTPPNAIITIAGHIPTNMLISGGCAPAIYSLIVEVIFFPTWGVFVYGIQDFPDWARYVETGNDTNAIC